MIPGVLITRKQGGGGGVCIAEIPADVDGGSPQGAFVDEVGNVWRCTWPEFHAGLAVVGFHDLGEYRFTSDMRAHADYFAGMFTDPLALAASAAAALAGNSVNEAHVVFLAWLRLHPCEIHAVRDSITLEPPPRQVSPVPLTRDLVDRLVWHGHLERIWPYGCAAEHYIWRLTPPGGHRIEFPA